MSPPSKPAAASETRARARRAVTDSEKHERRQAILAAAEAQLRRVGFEAFSMEVLAKEVGVARGTLYRYFATREDVLLSLYLEQRERFAQALTAAVQPGMEDDAFIRNWYDHATSDALFLKLQARLGSVIEQNITTETLVAAKLEMQRTIEEVATHLAHCLALEVPTARRLIVALATLILGAAEIDASPPLDSLPAALRSTAELFSSETVFTENARLILRGLRSSEPDA
ncbi:MAG: TetR family transcriptional regulator [Pseudomonadales bacterium]|jgi:AcrR family transcriptional regulator